MTAQNDFQINNDANNTEFLLLYEMMDQSKQFTNNFDVIIIQTNFNRQIMIKFHTNTFFSIFYLQVSFAKL